MGKGVLWNGKYYLIPQAGSRIDSSALANSPLGGANKVALLAEFTGLVPPKTPLKISSPSRANQLIHTLWEEARLAAQLIFDPSTGSQGASEVYLVAVNPCKVAALTIDTKLILTSYLYGQIANQIRAKVEAGTTIGKKVTVAYESNTETFDNLTKSSFSVVYTGAAVASALTINTAAATYLLTTVNTGSVDNVSLDLNTYTTIQSLCDALNATGKYTATVLTSTPTDSTLQLDNVTSQDIKTGAYTCKSDLQAIIDGINKLSGYVVATKVVDAAAVPTNVTWAYLAGGANGVTTAADWDSALSALETLNIDLLVPLTATANYHAKVDSHCRTMSGPSRKKERRCFVGGALQTWTSEANRITAVAALTAASVALNSDRTMHVGLGCKQYDPTGNIKLYPAYITACMYAGIAGGNSPVYPLTRKYLRCLGLEIDLRPSEIETLLDGNGVAVPIPDSVQGAGYVISRQLTTWNADDDLYRVEFSVGRGADYIAREVRNRHELLVGQPGTPAMDTTIINVTNSVLQMALSNDYINSYDPKKTQLRAVGTVRYVDYFAEPVLPINWIFSTYHLQPTLRTITL